MEVKNRFSQLNDIDVSSKTEDKNGLTYLSWAWAWGEFKKKFPCSTYKIYENEHGWPYFTDGKTCWVKTGVTLIDGDFSLEHIDILPIMDNRNKSIPFEQVNSMDINKTIQRSLTKAIGRHGLGLFIYAGEDLPESVKEDSNKVIESAIKEVQDCKSNDDLKKVCEKYRGTAVAKDAKFIKSANVKANELKPKQ